MAGAWFALEPSTVGEGPTRRISARLRRSQRPTRALVWLLMRKAGVVLPVVSDGRSEARQTPPGVGE